MQKAKFWLPFPQLFSLSGRMSRLQYFVYGLIYFAIFAAAFIGPFLGNLFQLDERGDLTNPTPLGLGLYFGTQLVFLYAVFILDAKRMHDLGWSGLFAILILMDVPLDTVIAIARFYTKIPHNITTIQTVVDAIGKYGAMGVGLFLTFRPGTKGKNKYGPDPLRPPAPPIDVF